VSSVAPVASGYDRSLRPYLALADRAPTTKRRLEISSRHATYTSRAVTTHPVPKGPLAVRWLAWELGEVRAGAPATATVEVENAGAATWRSGHLEGIQASYHWLDERGNPIVWDGLRTPFPEPVPPGRRARLELRLRGPVPPSRYRLALDLADETRCWFAEVGNSGPELEVDVLPRIGRALAARGGDPGALAAQEEPLVPEEEAEAVAHLAEGVAPAPDWSRRVLDAHQRGYGLVGGSVDVPAGLLRRRPRGLEPYAPGTGRLPAFPHPLLCPSVVGGVEPEWAEPVEGLPAARAPGGEPWLYDGRIAVRAALGRRR
jgi:hypothetical protein